MSRYIKVGLLSVISGLSQATEAYSLYFVWNFGSERFIRHFMGI